MGLGKVSTIEEGAHLRLPDRLYGREARLARLRSLYERASTGGKPAAVCLTGEPGVGKSALLDAFAAHVPGPVLAGTFEPDVPYSAVSAALARLDPGTATHRLVEAVGASADALIDLVPALRDVFGARPAVADLPAHHARARTQLAVRRLVTEIADAARPLLLILDDLHLADPASLDLLAALLGGPPIGYLLILTASAPQSPALRALGHSVTTLSLRPLPDSALTGLLADALGTECPDVEPLARQVAASTGSNPLSVRHFLHRLADARILTGEPEEANPVGTGDSARELIGRRLAALPADVRSMLATAAPIGAHVDPAVLATVARTSAETVTATLDPLAPKGFLIRDDHGYRWTHDEVRQAALALTPADERDALRLRIGRALLSDGRPDAVTHLNATMHLLDDPDERARLADLNLAAGQLAQRCGAPEAARAHYAAGLAALPDDPWRHWPDLAVALHLRAAEAEHVAGDSTRALQLLDRAMVRTNVDLSRAEVLAVHANLPKLRGEWDADAEPGLRALRLLGIDLPDNAAGWRTAADAALVTMRHRLSGLSLADLTARPPMTDRRALAAATLIATLLPSALVRPPDWQALLAARGVALALDHGATPASAIPYAFAGLILADQREYDSATLCMDAALTLVPDTRYAAQTMAVIALSLPPWRRSVPFAVGLLREAYADALRRGDQQFAKANWILYQMHLFASGTHLDAVAQENRAVWDFLAQHGDDPIVAMSNRAMARILDALRGTGTDATRPETPAEAQLAEACRAGTLGHASSVVLTRALACAVLLGEYDEALNVAETAQSVEPHGRGGFTAADRWFYHALTLTVLSDTAPPEQRRAWSAKLDELQAALDVWATAAPEAFGYRALLVAAERARLSGAVDHAVNQYSRAIAAAREHGCLPGEAISAELGGRYAAARGFDEAAVAYLRRARMCYEQWGAARKVEQLDQVLARLSGQPVPAPDALDLLAALQTTQTRYSLLDAAIAALPVPVVVLDADRNLRASSVPGTAVAGDVPATPLYDADGRLIGYVAFPARPELNAG